MEYETIKDRVNEINVFSSSIGGHLVALSEGYAKTEMETPKEILNAVGSIHGGCQFTIADDAACAAAASCGMAVVTLDVDFHYLNPGVNTSKICAEAKVIKKGRRIIVVGVEVYNQDGVQLSTATFTCTTTKKRFEEL